MLTDEERATLEPERREWLSINLAIKSASAYGWSDVDSVGILRDLARARLEIARLKAERLDALEDMLRAKHTYRDTPWHDGEYVDDCSGNPAVSVAMRELAEAGRLILCEGIGYWTDPDKRAEGGKP